MDVCSLPFVTQVWRRGENNYINRSLFRQKRASAARRNSFDPGVASQVALEVIDEERGVWEVLAEHLRRRARSGALWISRVFMMKRRILVNSFDRPSMILLVS